MREEQKRRQIAEEVVVARQQIINKSVTDSDFAEKTDSGARRHKGVETGAGTEILYRFTLSNGVVKTMSLTTGKPIELSRPEKLEGFGVDGLVSLRWQETTNEDELKIISGYHVERRLDGENKFTRVSDVPVVISSMLDETEILFQSPVFFEDEVDNGRTATYRVYSIDIFGRQSEYSAEHKIKVEKITPPNGPSVSNPLLSDYAGQTPAEADVTWQALQYGIQNNPGKRGVALPIFAATSDTVRLTIYRSKSVGARPFDTPEPLANIKFTKIITPTPTLPPGVEPTPPPESPPYIVNFPATYNFVNLNGGNHAVKKVEDSVAPDVVYFDTQLELGCTYKYWVSAWDKWNNESTWSQSVTQEIPTAAEPQAPDKLIIGMKGRSRPIFREAPGIPTDAVIFSSAGTC